MGRAGSIQRPARLSLDHPRTKAPAGQVSPGCLGRVMLVAGWLISRLVGEGLGGHWSKCPSGADLRRGGALA